MSRYFRSRYLYASVFMIGGVLLTVGMAVAKTEMKNALCAEDQNCFNCRIAVVNISTMTPPNRCAALKSTAIGPTFKTCIYDADADDECVQTGGSGALVSCTSSRWDCGAAEDDQCTGCPCTGTAAATSFTLQQNTTMCKRTSPGTWSVLTVLFAAK